MKQILLFLCLAATLAACSRTPSALQFEPIDGQIALLDRVYPVWFGEKIDILSQDIGLETVCDWIEYKSRVARQTEGWEDSYHRFLDNEMSLVTRNSIHADYWASVAAFEMLEPLYNGDTKQAAVIAEKCKPYTPDIAAHLDDEAQVFREFAQSEHLLLDNGTIAPAARPLVRLVHRYQWVKVTSEHFPIGRILPPEEMIAIFRYQVEKSAMPADKKLAHIDEMRAEMPGSYDYDFAEAMVRLQSGDAVSACTILKAAMPNLDDETLKKKYTQAANEISQTNPSACP